MLSIFLTLLLYGLINVAFLLAKSGKMVLDLCLSCMVLSVNHKEVACSGPALLHYFSSNLRIIEKKKKPYIGFLLYMTQIKKI